MLYLAPLDGEVEYWAKYDEIQTILGDISESGLRSLMFIALQKGWLRRQGGYFTPGVSLTRLGAAQLKPQFPALFPPTEDWSVLIFLQSNANDPSFRYLRKQLVGIHNLQISRGAYVMRGKLPNTLMTLLQSSYQQNVLVLHIDNCEFGDIWVLADQKFSLSDIVKIYSGISTEVDDLLKVKQQNSSLTQPAKQQLSSVFDRYYQNLLSDPGFYSSGDTRSHLPHKILANLRLLWEPDQK